MSQIKVITDETAIEKLKKAATGGTMRKVYSSMESALTAVKATLAIATELGIPVINAESEQFTDDTLPVVAIVGQRQEVIKNGKKTGLVGVKAVAFFPIPTLDAFLADDKGKEWLTKIAEKEACHVLFRGPRNASTAEELAAASFAASVEEIVRDARAEGVDTDWFDAVWPASREAIKVRLPQLGKALPKSKADIIKCLRSKAFAESQYETLEKANAFTGAIAAYLRRAGEVNKLEDGTVEPIDTSELDNWLAERDTKVLSAPQPVDYSGLEGADLSNVEVEINF